MNIMMIAPQPFFEPRGTPLSEYFRIKTLGDLGHRVDLITYPLGQDVALPGLTIFRSLKPPLIRSVKTGPSWRKVVLDFFLFLTVIRRMLSRKHHLVHTHEEGNIMGVFVSKIMRIPHLYDMHSSLVQQMDNFEFSRSRLLVSFFRFIERVSLRNARSVIVICRSLADYAAGITDPAKITLIENFLEERPAVLDEKKLFAIRGAINGDHRHVVLYAGTFEPYQGIPLLLESFRFLGREFKLVLLGGQPRQLEELKVLIREKRIDEKVLLLGPRPSAEIPYYQKAASVLVSPRIRGTNIPLKVYSALRSGVPLVATNLYSHTQTLNEQIAILVDPEPQAFARGIELAVGVRGRAVAQNALDFAAEHYTPEKYRGLVAETLRKAID